MSERSSPELADGYGARSVTLRDEVALDLYVSQDFPEGALVAREKGLVDLLALVRKPAPEQPIGRPLQPVARLFGKVCIRGFLHRPHCRKQSIVIPAVRVCFEPRLARTAEPEIGQ